MSPAGLCALYLFHMAILILYFMPEVLVLLLVFQFST